jgi:TolB-like protein/Tfp pilus assembly protein PilF
MPTAFVSVVERALASREGRYESAGALEAALVATLEDEGAVVVKQIHPARRQRSWWRARLGRIAATVAIAAGVLSAALSLGIWSAAPAGSIHAIAVLPLANLSNDPAQEYFADGMTDELIATLGRLEGINVISRTSVMRYKGSPRPLPEIAKTLGVDAVLEGAILTLPASDSRVAGGRRIRINARLIQAGTDTNLWNRTFERSGNDVLALQSEVARAVSEGVHARLARAPAARAIAAQDFEVFDLYLRGRYYWNMRSEEGLTQSVQYFQQVLMRDPRYAPAHAGLADAYNLLGEYGYLPREDAIARARAAALAAIDLDASQGEAQASLGYIQAMLLEWDAADASLRRAIELSSRYATGQNWYALLQAQFGRFDDAFDHIQTALALDPLSVSVLGTYGTFRLWTGSYDQAIEQFQAALRLEPRAARVRMNLSSALALRGNYDEARMEGEKAVSIAPGNPEILGNLACVLASSGQRSEAAAIARDLSGQYLRGEHAEPLAVAIVYAALGDNDRAFEWLYRGRERRDPWLGYLKVDTRFRTLKTDARYAQLVEDVGLPQ